VATTGRTVLVLAQTVMFVDPGLVVTSVTACAIWLVARRRPADHFRVVLMTLGAREVVAMILRLIRQAGVPVVGRYPRIRAVAQTTVLHGIEMARVLSGSRSAVVARRTGAENLVVIDRCYRRPSRCAVAILANIGCLDVGRSLANGIGAVVATHTVVHDVDVVKVGRQPGDCRMAVVAIIAAGDMGGVFAGCYEAVMTGAASTNDLRMVNGVNRHPDVRCMAVLADIGRLDVCEVLARSVGAVMAAGAISRDIYVIEIGWQPGNRRVTVIAIRAARNMLCILAGRDYAVMTGAAATQYLGVVNGVNRRPDIRVMAIFADIGRLNMRKILAGGFDTVVATDTIADDACVIEVGW